MSDHALGRYLDRMYDKNNVQRYSFIDIVKQSKMKANYLQEDGKFIRFYNGIAIVFSKEDDVVVSIVIRKNAKKGWRQL